MRGKTMKILDVGRAGEGNRSEGQNKTMERKELERKIVCVNWKRK